MWCRSNNNYPNYDYTHVRSTITRFSETLPGNNELKIIGHFFVTLTVCPLLSVSCVSRSSASKQWRLAKGSDKLSEGQSIKVGTEDHQAGL